MLGSFSRSHSAGEGSPWALRHPLSTHPSPGPWEAAALWHWGGLGLFFVVSPVPSYRASTRGSHSPGGTEIPWTILGIHSEHSVWGRSRAQRAQPRHNPLSALLTWDDILITTGQSWEICAKPQIWIFPEYYSNKKLNFVLFSCPISHFHVGNTYLLVLPSTFTQLQGISLKISGVHSVLLAQWQIPTQMMQLLY